MTLKEFRAAYEGVIMGNCGYDQETAEERLVAGSWVYGTFSTWIGDPEKNRAWELLIEAKQTYDRVVAKNHFESHRMQQLERQLAMAISAPALLAL